jgi:hypothetical protein
MAFELRYHPKSRSTKDVDLSIVTTRLDVAHGDVVAAAREALQRAAQADLGDFMQVLVGEPRRELHGPPQGGASVPVSVRLADKEYGRFHVDVALGEAFVGEPERLTGDDLLGFAGIPPATVRAISKAQQFAEKLHAYTFPWSDRENRRVKDLVDLMILIERGALDASDVRVAARATFAARAQQPLPSRLEAPPKSWRAEYAELAAEAGVTALDVDAAFRSLAEFWEAAAIR